MKGISNHTSGNSLSPLGARNKDIGSALQTLLTAVNYVCDVGCKTQDHENHSQGQHSPDKGIPPGQP